MKVINSWTDTEKSNQSHRREIQVVLEQRRKENKIKFEKKVTSYEEHKLEIQLHIPGIFAKEASLE